MVDIERLKKCVVFHIDMDGTMAKWNEDATVSQFHQEGYFSSLPETKFLPVVVSLYNAGFNVGVRSSVYQDEHSENDKATWLKDRHLGQLRREFIPYGTPKSKDMPNDNKIHVLIDDHTPNLQDWDANVQNGVAVKFINHINGKHGNWKGYRIREDMTHMEMVLNLLAIAEEARKKVGNSIR